MKRLLLASTLLLLVTVVGCDERSSTTSTPSEPLAATERPWIGDGPVASELVSILLLPEEPERTRRLAVFFSEREPSDLAAILRVVRLARYDVDTTAYALLADWWSDFDPQAAFEDASTWPVSDLHFGVAAVVRAWALHDPVAASVVVDAIPGEERAQRCIEALVTGWQDAGHAGLIEYIENLPQGALRQKALQAYLTRLATREGVEAPLRFAESRPDEGYRRFTLQVYRRAATAAAGYDPRRAAEWAELHADGPYGDGLLRRVGSLWAYDDPIEAMTWVTGLPDLTGRAEAVRETYRTWLSRDRENALAWMTESDREIGPVYQPAMSLVAVALSRDDPQAGLVWLERIEDEALWEQTAIALTRKWLQLDRDGALAWLEGSKLSDEVKQGLASDRRRQPKARRPGGTAREGSDHPRKPPAASR